MDGVDQAIQILISGADQGATNAVALATTAAAVATWRRIRSFFQGQESRLDPDLQQVLSADPGEEVDPQALHRLLQLLWESESGRGIIVHGDYVAHDKNVFNFDTR
jgi:hypothetical protein